MQIDDTHDIDVVMPMCNLTEYSDSYSKTSGSLWQYCRDEPVADANGDIDDVNEANAITYLFDLKAKMSSQTCNNGTKNIETMVPLKYLSNFWRFLEMLLIDCEINLDPTWSKKCIKVATAIADQGATFSIPDAKLYVPVVTPSTQDNAKLFEQSKSDFKRTV